MKTAIAAATIVALAITVSACGSSAPARRAPPPSATLDDAATSPASIPTVPTPGSAPPATTSTKAATRTEPTIETVIDTSAPTTDEQPESPEPGPRDQALDAAGFLDETGLVRLDADLPADAGTVDALCTAAFGPPRSLAKRLKLPRQLEQRDGGVMTSEIGPFLLCAYYVGDALQVIAEVGQSFNTWDGGHNYTVKDGTTHATISYNPDHTGQRIRKKAARTYLRTVLDTLSR